MAFFRFRKSPRPQHIPRTFRGSMFSYSSRATPSMHQSSPQKNWKQLLATIAMVVGGAFILGTATFIALIIIFSKDLPDPSNITKRIIPQTTKIFDRTGNTILYEVRGDQNRTIVELNQIAPAAIQATIAIEDKDFFTHNGISLRGIARSLYRDIITRSKSQGGSTITQQFVKNSILTNEKTFTRKLKEIILSFEMERRFSKEQILKLYLNEIPYGGGNYGIESAAQTFFGKSAKDLTLSESAILAALPQAPTYFSPYSMRTDELMVRARLVLDTMVAQKFITPSQAATAKKDDPLTRVRPKRDVIKAPHFIFYMREKLADLIGEQAVEQGGLKITTTLDTKLQNFAETSVTQNVPTLKKYGASTAALLALDPKNGDILSMVGSADYFDDTIQGQFNALTGLRQPGSSMKPIVYGAGFEKGYTPDTILYDVKTTFKNYPKDYTPNNYDLKERGPVTVRQAMAGSLNIPAVQMMYLVGQESFQNMAGRLGYTTFTDKTKFGLSAVLGGADVKPIEHIAAFTAFAQEGILVTPRSILRVVDKNGAVLYDATSQPVQTTKVFDPEIARQITSIMSDNTARTFIFGAQNLLTLPDRPIAAKTGTTNEYKDGWTIGFTPSIVTGVWTGNARGKAMKFGADGSKVAAPIWNAFMKNALAGTPVEQFTPPQQVVTGKPVLDGNKTGQMVVKIDKISGKLATIFTPPEYVVEQGYGTPHSILYFVDKDNPRGPVPTNPANDPQFANWEAAVQNWAAKQNFNPNSSPPTETDDVHVLENIPTITIVSPIENESIPSRIMTVSVSASARRGVANLSFALDGDTFAQQSSQLFNTPLTIPNRFVRGFHTLRVTASDDVGNSASASVVINITADLLPVNMQWISPAGTSVGRSLFPLNLQFTLDDPKSVQSVALSVINSSGVSTIIGSISSPSLPNLTIPWTTAPSRGTYQLVTTFTFGAGETQTDQRTITVQ